MQQRQSITVRKQQLNILSEEGFQEPLGWKILQRLYDVNQKNRIFSMTAASEI